MNDSHCPTHDIDMPSRASRRRQRQRVVRAKMQSQANHVICLHKVPDISGTTAGLVVAADADGFDEEAKLGSRTESMPTEIHESKEEDSCDRKTQHLGKSTMIHFSSESLGLMTRFGNPLELRESMQKTGEVIQMLDNEDWAERRQLVAWLAIYARQLALSTQGCRVLQKAIEMANSSDRTVLTRQLEPHVLELAGSPHGNYVLAKMVERMPPSSISFVIEQLQGKASIAARNRYGCRILERLIEHCSEQRLAVLVKELIADADSLSRHPFGNFVVQHLLEHGTMTLRSCIVQHLLPSISTLAMHRSASHVVQKALDFSNNAMQTEMMEAFLEAECPKSLVNVACSRYGSYVVSHFARIPCTSAQMRAHFSGEMDLLQKSEYGKRTIECFRLVPCGQQLQHVPSMTT